MEEKKSRAADLERKRKYFFLFGLLLSVGLFLLVLNVPLTSTDGDVDADLFEDIMQELDLKKEDDKHDEVPLFKPEEPPKGERLREVDKIEVAEPDLTETTPQAYETEVEDPSAEELLEEPTPLTMTDDKDNVLSWRVVEQLPEFPGGMSEFMKWLTESLKYPVKAQQDKIQGVVHISFVVNKDGSIADLKVVKSANKLLDDEALRVMKMMPPWKNGEDKGKPCRTLIAIPIVFML